MILAEAAGPIASPGVTVDRPSRSIVSVLLLTALVACQGPGPTPTVGGAGPTPTAGASSTTPTSSATPAIARPPACTEIGQRWVSPSDDETMVCVPGGGFRLGADDDDTHASPNERPRHQVVLSAFWIDRTEVTNRDFEICVELGWCKPRPAQRGTTGVASRTRLDYYHDPAFADFPVLIYTPEEADAYCRCMGRRLPTEAEFEAAARGTDGRRYPWGDELDCLHASYFGCTDDTTDVETPAEGASPYGALNLAGNVWEWASDWYSDTAYAGASEVDPTGPTSGEYKVRRGGGFSSLASDLRATTRASGDPQHYFDGQMGFRCAVSASP